MSSLLPLSVVMLLGAAPEAAPPKVLTLADALKSAAQHSPRLRASQAQIRATTARVGEAEAGYYPRVDAQLQYQRSTANFTITPAFAKSAFAATLPPGRSFDTVNYYLFGATAQETIYDFGRTGGAVAASEAGEKASRSDLVTQEQSVELSVRTAYLNALATKALVQIGEQTFENQKKHVRQVAEFVEAGTRPKIDRTSAELNLANAELSLVSARNSLARTKVALNQAIGVEGPLDYDVVDPEIPPLPEEAQPIDALLDTAVRARPEVASLEAQLLALEAQKRSIRGSYYPALIAATNFSGGTVNSFPVGFNWYLGLGLSWNIFAGFQNERQISEIEANIEGVEAQRDVLRQSIRSDLEQQLLAVDDAKHRLDVAQRAVETAEERLRLAEGRYQAGAGDILELDDAQVTDANAKAQRVQAQYDLALARARLAYALGASES